MPARKLVVSTYLQYIVLALGVVLLVAFVRQIGGVLLTFLAAGVLAYVLNPLVRRLEELRVPRAIAVIGVFLVLILVVVVTLLLIIVPSVGQVQIMVRNPQDLVDQAIALLNRAPEHPLRRPVRGRAGPGPYPATPEGERAVGRNRSRTSRRALSAGCSGSSGPSSTSSDGASSPSTCCWSGRRSPTPCSILFPETVRDQSLELFYAVERSLIKYLRGQLLLCAIMGVLGWAIMFFTVGEYCPRRRGLGGGHGDHPRPRGLPRGHTGGR